jgi:hypothetical protein
MDAEHPKIPQDSVTITDRHLKIAPL